jgi:integrase
MLYNGREFPALNGSYQIRHYVGDKAVYTTVGDDLDRAEAALSQMQDTMQLNVLNAKLGVKLPEPEKAKKTVAQYKETFWVKYAVGRYDKVALYTVVANDLCKLLSLSGRLLPEEIEEADIIRLDPQWEARGLAKTTRSNRYTTVRCFLRHSGVDPDKLIDKPTNQKLKSEPTTLPEVYTDEEVAKLIAASSERHALVWESFWKRGFRDEELAFLEWENIDWKNKTAEIRFKSSLNWKPKDSEERLVPVPESLITKHAAWRGKNPATRFVFGTKNDRPDIKFLKALKSDWRAAGLNCGKCKCCIERSECGDAYLHKFRSSYLTRMHGHCNSRDVVRLAGHSSLETTLHYLRPSAMPQLQAAANAAWA